MMMMIIILINKYKDNYNDKDDNMLIINMVNVYRILNVL